MGESFLWTDIASTAIRKRSEDDVELRDTMASVTESIKESLVGVVTEPQLSESSRTEFLKNAHKAEDGEYYMTEQEFINAIAPTSEDYVSACASIVPFHNALTLPSCPS